MVQVRSESTINTPEQQYEEMCKRVATFTDKLGATIDDGIFDTVVALNLLGFHTFQSCEGHLDHGYPYPWVTVLDDERTRMFNRLWMSVCELEEQAKVSKTESAYDHYLRADVELRLLTIQWEADDDVYRKIIELLSTFSKSQERHTHSARLFVKRLHPGLYRIEPAFSMAVKKLPDSLTATYLTRGQTEMQNFANFLKKEWLIRQTQHEKQ